MYLSNQILASQANQQSNTPNGFRATDLVMEKVIFKQEI